VKRQRSEVGGRRSERPETWLKHPTVPEDRGRMSEVRGPMSDVRKTGTPPMLIIQLIHPSGHPNIPAVFALVSPGCEIQVFLFSH